MLEQQGYAGVFAVSDDLDRAVDGADYVLVQIRVGGQQARLTDETMPLACGCIGQETTGAGGLGKALRTVLVVLQIAERARELVEGGSLFWVFRGEVLCRQRLIDVRPYVDQSGIGRCQLVLDPNLSAVGDSIPNYWKQQYVLDPFDPNLGSKDSDGDGMNNLQEYLAGTDPTNSVSAFRISSITRLGNDVRVTWFMGSGKTNALQFAGGSGFTTNFVDLFTVTNTVGSGTNYLDIGGATNMPARFYRVRLVP